MNGQLTTLPIVLLSDSIEIAIEPCQHDLLEPMTTHQRPDKHRQIPETQKVII